jgi:hypothetical protein
MCRDVICVVGNGIQEVSGSTPLSSTNESPPVTPAGFRLLGPQPASLQRRRNSIP